MHRPRGSGGAIEAETGRSRRGQGRRRGRGAGHRVPAQPGGRSGGRALPGARPVGAPGCGVRPPARGTGGGPRPGWGPDGVGVAEWLAGAGFEVALVTPGQIAGTMLSLTGDLADANIRLQRAGVRRSSGPGCGGSVTIGRCSRTCGPACSARWSARRWSTAATGCPRSPSIWLDPAPCAPATAWRLAVSSRQCWKADGRPCTSPASPAPNRPRQRRSDDHGTDRPARTGVRHGGADHRGRPRPGSKSRGTAGPGGGRHHRGGPVCRGEGDPLPDGLARRSGGDHPAGHRGRGSDGGGLGRRAGSRRPVRRGRRRRRSARSAGHRGGQRRGVHRPAVGRGHPRGVGHGGRHQPDRSLEHLRRFHSSPHPGRRGLAHPDQLGGRPQGTALSGAVRGVQARVGRRHAHAGQRTGRQEDPGQLDSPHRCRHPHAGGAGRLDRAHRIQPRHRIRLPQLPGGGRHRPRRRE